MKKIKKSISLLMLSLLLFGAVTQVQANPVLLISVPSGVITEDGAIATFDVTLEDAPSANVTMSVGTEDTTSDGSTPQCLVSTDGVTFEASVNLIFTSGDYTSAQTVTVGAVDDTDVENQHFCEVKLIVTSIGSNYDDIEDSTTIEITDNDVAGAASLIVYQTEFDVDEGNTKNFLVSLSGPVATTQDVVVSLVSTDGTQCSIDQASLTFNTGNWNTPQTVVYTAIDDLLVESDHTCSVTLNTTSADGDFNGLSGTTLGNITDNDSAPVYTAGVSVSPTTINIAEGGSTDGYAVVLTSEPSDTVVIDSAGDTQCSVTNGAQLTFSTGNWNTPQPVTVEAVDDSDVEGTHTCLVSVSVNGGTPATEYAGYDPDDVTANITDNDSAPVYTAGVTVSPTTINIAEGGATDGYAIVLTSEPSDTVVIDSAGDTQCSVTNGAQLSFSTGNWNTPQTVTVTAIDDSDVEGTHTCLVNVSVNGGTPATEYAGYDPDDVTANITDNDSAPVYTAGVSVSPTTINIAEGGATDAYTIVLTSEPSDTVVIDSAGDTQCSVTNGAQLTFSTGNWNIPQTVTVAAVDDSDVEGVHTCTISVSVNGGTPATEYAGYDPDDVTANITDNDSAPVYTAGVTVSPTTISIAEGGATSTYAIVLNSEPSNTVVINNAGDAQCTVTNGSQLSFNTGNWNVAQIVTVAAVDDSAVEGNHTCTVTVSLDGATTAAEYAGYNPADVTANITDNDPSYTPGLTVSPTSVNITEGGTQADFGVTLNSPPSANVVISVASNDTGQCTVSLSSLIFNSGNWNSTQTVRITATDDTVDEADGHTCIVSLNVASTDGDYNGRTASVTASITDNDPTPPVTQAAIIITETDGTTWISEAGGTDVFYLSLSTLPKENVEILISTDAQCTVNDTQITFTQNSWNSLKTVQVSAVDDASDEADNHTCKVNFTTIDAYTAAAYQPVSASLNVTVKDNDTSNPGVILNPSSLVMNEGEGRNFRVSLQSQPSDNVIIKASTSDSNVCTVSPSEFTLTSNSWQNGKDFTVSGAYNISYANLACDVYLKAISADPHYHRIGIATMNTVIYNTYSQAPTTTPYPLFSTYTPWPTVTPWASSTPWWATSTSIPSITNTPDSLASNTPDNGTLAPEISTNTPTPQSSEKTSPSLGVIAVIVVSTLVLFGAVGVGAYFIIQKYF